MERAPRKEKSKKEKDDSRKIWWINTGGTHRRPGGKIIKPGQKFKAYPEDIPEAFRDVIKPVDGTIPTQPTVKVEKVVYTIKECGEDMFDVLDANGKIVNESPLSEGEAHDLIASLS